MRAPARVLLILAALLGPGFSGLGAAVGGDGEGDAPLQVLPTSFPPRLKAVALWTGSEILLVGGEGQDAQVILHIDPVTHAVRAGGSLPHPLKAASAVWTGQAAYVFGGDAPGDEFIGTDTIYRYDPETRAVTLLPTRFPSVREGAAAVWDGTHAYVYGGSRNLAEEPGAPVYGATLRAILQFDPVSGNLTQLPQTLPEGRGRAMSAFWHNGSTYLFGGENVPTAAQILRHTPASGTIDTLPTSMPRSFFLAPGEMAYDGSHGYLIGGTSLYPFQGTDMIARFDPATGSVAYMTALLPNLRGFSAVVSTGDSLLVLGGESPTPVYRPQGDMLRYTPSLDAVNPAQADLKIHACGFTRDTVYEGEMAGAKALIQNDGITATEPTTATLSIGGTRVGTFPVPALEPGSHQWIDSGLVWNGTAGYPEVVAEVNANGTGPEYRFDNNRCVTREWVRPYVDVSVTILSVTPYGQEMLDGAVPYRSRRVAEVQVCNQDDLWPTQGYVNVYAVADAEVPLGPQHLDSGTVYPLAPGACATRAFYWDMKYTHTMVGTYRVRATVTPDTIDPLPEDNVHEVEDSYFVDPGAGVVVGDAFRVIDLLNEACYLSVNPCALV